MKNRLYPKRLYPSKNNKRIVVDFSMDEHYLLRYSDSNRPIYTSESDLGKHFHPSRFFNGCSVNLLSVYRKCDARYLVHGKADAPQHQEWNEGDSSFLLKKKDYRYKKNRGFLGVKIGDLKNTFIDKAQIKVNGAVIREDKIFFDIEHAPTKCNFWHFNIMIYGINSNTNDIYRLRDVEGYSNSQMGRVALKLVHRLENKLVLSKGLK